MYPLPSAHSQLRGAFALAVRPYISARKSSNTEAAGDSARFPDAGEAWSPAKLYYAVIPRSGFKRFAELLREAGIEPPFARNEQGDRNEQGEEPGPTFGVSDDRVTTIVDVSGYVDVKHSALAAHRTQMGQEQFFMRLPMAIFGEIFGRETFQRMSGPTAGSPEVDLFSGL